MAVKSTLAGPRGVERRGSYSLAGTFKVPGLSTTGVSSAVESRTPALPKDWIADWRTHHLPVAQLQRFIAQQLLARSLPGEAGRFRREARTAWSIISFAESYGIDLEPLMATVGPPPAEASTQSTSKSKLFPFEQLTPAAASGPSQPNEQDDGDDDDADENDAQLLASAPTGVSQRQSARGVAGGIASHAAVALYTSALEMRLRKAAESRPPPTAWKPENNPHGDLHHHHRRPITDQPPWREEEELAADPSEPEPEALWGNWRPPESTELEPPEPLLYQGDGERLAHARRVARGRALRKARLRHEELEEERRAEQAAAYAAAVKARLEAEEEWVDEDVVVVESRYEQLQRLRRRPRNRTDNIVILTEEED